MKMMATLSAPFSISTLAAAQTSSSLTAARIVPSASVRSSTSRRISRSAIVAKTARRDDADPGAAPLQQRVGADRGAVNDRSLRDIADRREAVEKTLRLVAAPRGHFRGGEAACRRIEPEQVRERAADVDADNDAHARALSVAAASTE